MRTPGYGQADLFVFEHDHNFHQLFGKLAGQQFLKPLCQLAVNIPTRKGLGALGERGVLCAPTAHQTKLSELTPTVRCLTRRSTGADYHRRPERPRSLRADTTDTHTFAKHNWAIRGNFEQLTSGCRIENKTEQKVAARFPFAPLSGGRQ